MVNRKQQYPSWEEALNGRLCLGNLFGISERLALLGVESRMAFDELIK
jgi:hypothetical protein